jgi:mannan endo-1,4-beta-mannosidase
MRVLAARDSLTSSLVMVATVAIALLAVTFAITGLSTSPPPATPAHASLRPVLASYLGVFESGAPPAYQPVAEFGQVANRAPNLVGYYSGWAESFNTAFANEVHRHHGIPFVQIDPKFGNLPAIAAGDYDPYLSQYAASVRDYRHAVVIGFGHEMNGNWYSWGYGHVQPKTFVAAWRHIVKLFRREGADNVTWLWTVNASNRGGVSPVASWWPGSKYVTWVGIDGYYYREGDDFEGVFGRTIDEVRKFTNKPVLLSETAVAPGSGQFASILDLFHGMANYKTLGLVWFDLNQNNGIYHQDWRIEDSGPAQAAFQLGIHKELTPAKISG